jgi:hypothetical protein
MEEVKEMENAIEDVKDKVENAIEKELEPAVLDTAETINAVKEDIRKIDTKVMQQEIVSAVSYCCFRVRTPSQKSQ